MGRFKTVNAMAESNKDKIQEVLSKQFNKYRYIFWYDAEGAMEELVMGLAVEGMKFSADMASLYATECNIPMELKERIIDDHLSKLLKNKLIVWMTILSLSKYYNYELSSYIRIP